jgi:hypothetical protein
MCIVIKPESLDFRPLHCSLERALGDYYQDFSPAIALVEAGFHGRSNAQGIPLLSLPGQGEFANAVTTAQYALANMTAVRRGERGREPLALAQLDWLVEMQECGGEWAGCWLMRHDNPKYTWLRAPWTGALASGNAISALLRGSELFGVAKYRASADAAYGALHAQRQSNHLYQDAGDGLWYEEYPGHPALHVLNGHVYTLLGVLDYARVSGSSEAEGRWRRGLRTTRDYLDRFDVGYWSLYDLRFREPTNVHYHKNIHIPQLRILAALTNEAYFADVAERWDRYLHSFVARTRWALSLRLRRFRTP